MFFKSRYFAITTWAHERVGYNNFLVYEIPSIEPGAQSIHLAEAFRDVL